MVYGLTIYGNVKVVINVVLREGQILAQISKPIYGTVKVVITVVLREGQILAQMSKPT